MTFTESFVRILNCYKYIRSKMELLHNLIAREMCTVCAKSPFPGALTVTFMLHRWPWQHLTTWAGEGGLAQVALPSSSSLRQPFCWTATPSIIFREEKHCWPVQRWSRSHMTPSHTQYWSLRTGLPADSSVSDMRKQRYGESH